MKPILAVFDIEAKGIAIPSSTLDRLSEFVGVIVLEHGVYRVVPRDQIRGRLRRKKKESYKRCYDHSCQIDIGRELAATKVLSTKIVRLGSQCAVSATIYDLKTATAESAARRIGDCEESALAAMLIPVMERVGGGRARALPDDSVSGLSGPAPSRTGGGRRSIRLGCDDCEIGVDRESGPVMRRPALSGARASVENARPKGIVGNESKRIAEVEGSGIDKPGEKLGVENATPNAVPDTNGIAIAIAIAIAQDDKEPPTPSHARRAMPRERVHRCIALASLFGAVDDTIITLTLEIFLRKTEIPCPPFHRDPTTPTLVTTPPNAGHRAPGEASSVS